MRDPTFWILARASGLTAYACLTCSVLMGIAVKSRPFRRFRQASITDVHRLLALIGLGMIGLHGIALVLDSTVRIPLLALLVPGLVAYKPVATAIGVLTAELMVLVYVSFGLRRRIGTKNWRRLHWATYAVFVAATVHGLSAGTDTSRPWAVVLYLGAIGLVTAAATWRALAPRSIPTPAQGGSR